MTIVGDRYMDALHDFYMDKMDKFDRVYKKGENPYGYLFTSIANYMKDYRKKESKRRDFVPNPIMEENSDTVLDIFPSDCQERLYVYLHKNIVNDYLVTVMNLTLGNVVVKPEWKPYIKEYLETVLNEKSKDDVESSINYIIACYYAWERVDKGNESLVAKKSTTKGRFHKFMRKIKREALYRTSSFGEHQRDYVKFGDY